MYVGPAQAATSYLAHGPGHKDIDQSMDQIGPDHKGKRQNLTPLMGNVHVVFSWLSYCRSILSLVDWATALDQMGYPGVFLMGLPSIYFSFLFLLKESKKF